MASRENLYSAAYGRRTRSGAWTGRVLRRQPTSQQEGQSERSDDDYERHDNQCQQEANLVRLPNPRVLPSIHHSAPGRVPEVVSSLGTIKHPRSSEHTGIQKGESVAGVCTLLTPPCGQAEDVRRGSATCGMSLRCGRTGSVAQAGRSGSGS